MKESGCRLSYLAAAILLVLLLAGCLGEKIAPYGTVDVDLMDAPSLEYTNVYLTVSRIAFHASPDAGSDASGWEVHDVSAQPVTIDLAKLVNGRLYADTSPDGMPLFSNLELPIGTYRQIRLYLASGEETQLTASARALGLKYNNQATFEDGASAVVRIPNAAEGIKIVPETPFVVAVGKRVRLALDFNLMDDMFDVYSGGQVECIMKPRVGYFDMASVGAVKGKVAYHDFESPYFVIKAQQVDSGKNCRVVRRTATVDEATGEFNLYPLPVFGNNTTAVYDILLRGDNVQTTIVKNVKVRRGTTPASGAVDLGTIPINPGSEFKVQLRDPLHPTGAWVNFYQTLTTDPVPFEVRSLHLDPYTGTFVRPFGLSGETLQVFDFSEGRLSAPISDVTTTPGGLTAVAEAILYERSAGVHVAAAPGSTATFALNPPTALPGANRIDAEITIPEPLRAGLNEGYIFITSGGLIIDCYPLDSLMAAGGGTFTIPNLPGGTTAAPLPRALYGVGVFGWGGGNTLTGRRFNIDLSTGSASTAVTLTKQ